MKVKCVSNLGTDLPDDALDPKSGFDKSTKFLLEIGKKYIVYGITIYNGYHWYYLCDEGYTYYPRWNPSPLFEIDDHRLSHWWVYSYEVGNGHPIIAFKEWCTDIGYYERLVDGEESAVALFEKYKVIIDLEFPSKDFKTAAIAQNNWVSCEKCAEIWEEQTNFGIIKCPSCKILYNNPFWKSNMH